MCLTNVFALSVRERQNMKGIDWKKYKEKAKKKRLKKKNAWLFED